MALAQLLSCEICKIFTNTCFIQYLWTTASHTKQTLTVATTEFFSKISNRKKISDELFNLCETEISIDETIKSINSDIENKSPGKDSVTAEFFNHFSSE